MENALSNRITSQSYSHVTGKIITDPVEQIGLVHENTDGWIALCQKTKDSFTQYHYKINNIASEIHRWVDFDSYFSMNTFYTPKRLLTNLREIRALYVDLDCYNIGFTSKQVVMNLKTDYFGTVIPTPNLINYSGRGVNLIWFIQPISGLALERWNPIQSRILKELKNFGADNSSIDAARVFRLAGSINSKSEEIVYSELLHTYRYDFQEVVEEYFPTLKRVSKVKKKKRTSKTTSKQNKASVSRIFNEFSLVKTRMMDINTLVELRKGDMTGVRELTLFLYRYWALCCYNVKEKALSETIKLNDSFNDPLPINEVVRDTKSAEMYFDSEEEFRISNPTIIEWLKITNDEQKHLASIISKTEKRRRNTAYQREKRGSVSREEYKKTTANETEKKLNQLKELIAKGLKQKQIAEEMGISISYVKKLKQKLKS